MLRLYHGDECLTIPAHDVESPQRSVTNLMNKVEYKVLGAELLGCSSQIIIRAYVSHSNIQIQFTNSQRRQDTDDSQRNTKQSKSKANKAMGAGIMPRCQSNIR